MAAAAEVRTAYKKAWYEANKARIAARAAELYQQNREKKLAYQKAYTEVNRERVIARQREYHAANRDARLAAQREYRERNPNKYREWADANKETLAAKKSARKKANPAQNAAHAMAYHAGKLRRTVPFSDARAIAAVYAEAARRRAQGEDVHVDHEIPLRGRYVSGLHVHWNLRIIPKTVNLRKYNKFEP